MTPPRSFDRPFLECANRHLQLLSRTLGGVGVCLAVNDLFSPHLLLPFLHYSPLHNRRNFMLRRPTIIMTFDMLVFLSARTIKEIQRPLSVTSDDEEEHNLTPNFSPISLPLFSLSDLLHKTSSPCNSVESFEVYAI